MKKHLLCWLTFGLILFIACKKEESFETGGVPSDGSLQADASGDCLPKTVNGIYIANTALSSSTNTLSVQVNVNAIGNYLVYTDTVNGYYFRASGIFTSTGPVNVILRGAGTPFQAGVDNFVVRYDSTQCDIAVQVSPVGTGPAVFTYAGAGASCTGATVSGTYGVGVPLVGTTNTVTLSVNVTTPGTYSITTPTTGGMTFTATGAFTNTGTQNVTLAGSGNPTASGPTVVPVSTGAGSCTFTVNVSGTAAGTMTCAGLTTQGTYTANVAVTAANTISVPVNFTSTGAFTISSNTVDGLSFTITGSAVATGTQTITVPAVGTPLTAGTKNFTLQYNGSATGACTFTIAVQPGAGGPAQGSLAGSPNACSPANIGGTYTQGVALSAANTVQLQLNVTQAGTYSITSNTQAGFSFTGSGNVASGSQNVTLTASSTAPTANGPQTFTVSFGGASTCTFVVNVNPPAAAVDYFPTTVGSNWSYEIDDDPNDSLYIYVDPTPKVVNGNTYRIFMSRDGAPPEPDSSSYYRKAGSDYYEWMDVGEFIGFNPPAQWAEYIFLKDNVPDGATWNSQAWTGTIQTTSANVRFLFTIEDKDITVPILTSTSPTPVSYNNVIVVKQQYQVEVIPGQWTTITPGPYFVSYFARGVGLIQVVIYDDTGAEYQRIKLRRKVVL